MFYRMFDTQTGNYMATGYNAASMEELKVDYISYKSVDFEEGDRGIYELASEEEIFRMIEADEFMIEESEKPFEVEDNPFYWSS